MEEAYSRLANAIIVQAVKDYQEARERLEKLEKTEPPVDVNRHTRWKNRMIQTKSTIKNVEQFFASGWFSRFTDLDGEELLEKVKQMEVAEWNRN